MVLTTEKTIAWAVGIDPGLTGGMASVALHPGWRFRVIAACRMPVLADLSKDLGDSKQVDGQAVRDFVVKHEIDARLHGEHFSICVERQQAMPGQGVSSTFRNGMNYGIVVQACRLQAPGGGAVPLFGARGTVWKRDMGLSKDKERSRRVATQLFGTDLFWKRKADEGVAEAALLAAWRLRRFMQATGITP